MLLQTIGHHVQLTKIDGAQGEKFIFPSNTSDDVVIDEEGTTLTNYIPSITTNLDEQGAPMVILENESTDTISDDVLNAIITA